MLQTTLQFGRQDKKEEECLFKKTTDYYYFMCDEILPPFNFSLLIPYIKKTKQTSKKKTTKPKPPKNPQLLFLKRGYDMQSDFELLSINVFHVKYGKEERGYGKDYS